MQTKQGTGLSQLEGNPLASLKPRIGASAKEKEDVL